LEIGVLDLDGEDPVIITQCACAQSSSGSLGRSDPMKHTDAEIEEAAGRFEALAHSPDPDIAIPDDLSDLRAIAEAAEQVRRDEALIAERVAAARAHGRS
jgi:hypothetical protein